MPVAQPPPLQAASPLCLGGSFNPPHHGHLIAARVVAERAGFARVRLIVAGRSPHKPDDGVMASAEHRVQMCRLAVAGDPWFEVDDRETRRPGPSFTIDTARELAREPAFAGRPVPWLIGADLLPGLVRWHESAALLSGQIVQFVVMRRPKHAVDWSSLPREIYTLRSSVIEAPQIDISATDVRRRLHTGGDVRYLVPETVRQYIEQQGLYAT